MARDPIDPADKLTQELRRGTVVLAALSRLVAPKYGYALLEELSSYGLEVEQGTLYPLLRRLDEQGLLESSWNVEGTRPRKYYQLSPAGARMYEALTGQWAELVEVLGRMVEDSRGAGGDTNEPE